MEGVLNMSEQNLKQVLAKSRASCRETRNESQSSVRLAS